MADIFKAVTPDVMVSFCSYANKSLNSPFQFYFVSAHASKAPFSPAPPPFVLSLYYRCRCLNIYLLKNRQVHQISVTSRPFVFRQWVLDTHVTTGAILL